MNAEEYFEKEYGSEHLKEVCKDEYWISLFGLIDEFADYIKKNCKVKKKEKDEF